MKSRVMKRAWEIKKFTKYSFAEALKFSWKVEKDEPENFQLDVMFGLKYPGEFDGDWESMENNRLEACKRCRILQALYDESWDYLWDTREIYNKEEVEYHSFLYKMLDTYKKIATEY